MYYSLAPLCVRRCIAMLGVLFRVATGKAPSPLRRFFRPSFRAHFPRDLREGERHRFQLDDPIHGESSRQARRSILGMIYTFNCLPSVVFASTTKEFQRNLQAGVKMAVRRGLPNWKLLLRNGVYNMPLSSFQQFFIDSAAEDSERAA